MNRFGIEAMLQLEEDACYEALKVYDDSQTCKIELPLPLHISVLEASLVENDIESATRITHRMLNEVNFTDSTPTCRDLFILSWSKYKNLPTPYNKSYQELFNEALSAYTPDIFVPAKYFLALHENEKEVSKQLFVRAREVLGDAFPDLPEEEVEEEAEEKNEDGDGENTAETEDKPTEESPPEEKSE